MSAATRQPKLVQCAQCQHASRQGTVSRALGLLLPATGFVCRALDEAPAGIVTATLVGLLSVAAKRNECPNFAALPSHPDGYLADDLS